jgi:hypothetical protein
MLVQRIARSLGGDVGRPPGHRGSVVDAETNFGCGRK